MRQVIVFFMLSLFLSGCGLRPLYGNGGQVVEQTQAIQIQPISGEGGYQMSLILQDRLNPQHQTGSKKYRLTVTLEKPTYVNQSIRSDNFASLETMRMKANYQLVRLSDSRVLVNSSVDSNGMFNLIKSPYATVVAQDKLYENLIKIMADDIATHILSYFKGDNS